MINNIIIGVIILCIILSVFILYKIGKIQKSNIIEWLLYAVTEAEKQLGSGTGEIKLRQTYGWFVGIYPVVSKFISFETFSNWVDIALDNMEEILKNEKIKEYIEN